MSTETETVMTEAEFGFLLDQLKNAQGDSEYWELKYKEEAFRNIELEKENRNLRLELRDMEVS